MLLKIKIFLLKFQDVHLKPNDLWFVFILVSLLTIFRRVDLITHAQFWAEDGTVWFEDIYNLGWWPTIVMPMTGYLQTISRLVGFSAQQLPLAIAPLFFNLVAVAIKALPVVYLFSDRWYKVVPNLWFKIAIAFVYIFLPNTSEVHANITNAHWFLALITLMILLGDLSKNIYIRILEAGVLLLACLSGPFSVFLLPIIFLIWLWLPEKRNFINLSIVGFAGLVQVFLLLMGGVGNRSSMILGATPWLFVKIYSGQVVLGSLVGKIGYAFLYNRWLVWENWLGVAIYLSAFIVGVGSVGLTLWKGKKELKLIVLFGLVILLFSLLKPMASLSLPQWQVMAIPGAAGRYWFFPMLSFVLSLLFLSAQKNWPKLRILALLVCIFWLWGLRVEGVYKAWPDLHFKEQVKIFEQLPVGSEMKFKVMPENWHAMILKKH